MAPFQGPVIYNRTAAAAGHTMRVLPEDLLAAARGLSGFTDQGAAIPGLRLEPAAAGNPQAGQALSALGDQFAVTLAALDADRGAAVRNLNESARMYESVEVALRQHTIDVLGRLSPPPTYPGIELPGLPAPRSTPLEAPPPSGTGTGPTGGGPSRGGPPSGGPPGQRPAGRGR